MPISATNIAILKGHSGSIYDLSEGPAESLIFSASSDKIIALWNLETMQAENFAATLPELLYEICYIREKNVLLAGTASGAVHVIDLTKKKEVKILQHHTSAIFEINYSVDTNCFYTCSGNGEFAVCSLETLSLIKVKKIGVGKIRSIDFNTKTSEMALASGDGNIRIFDLLSLEEKNCFNAHRFSANIVRYTPDFKTLISGGKDAHLNFWDVEKKYAPIKSIPAHNFAIYDIAFHPSGNLFATASRDKTIKIWDANTYDFLLRINMDVKEGHTHSVNKLLWLTYKNYLISAGDDRTIRIWEVTVEN
jgi:WD40 repeat protein